VVLAAAVLAAVVLAGLGYELAGQWRDQARYRPPGTLLSVAGSRLHVLDQGSGEPAVMLEAGIAGSLLGWAHVQGSIAEFTRAMSYDRAGLGWSDKIVGARTLDTMLRELAELQRAVAGARPMVLVGHSFGALLVRAYAHRFPDKTAGLVLVDPASADAWSHCTPADRKRLAMGVSLARRGALLARFGIVRITLDLLASGGRRLPAIIGKAAGGRGASTMTRLIGEVQLLPPECAPRIRSHWSNAKCFNAMAQYLECLPAVAAEVERLRLPAHVPVTVLSAGTATASELRERERWAADSARGRHIIVADAGHWIQIRRPEAVVNAVRDLVTFIRESDASAAVSG